MPLVRSILAAATAISVGICLAVAAATGSYAYLSTTVPVSFGATITAGSSAITLKLPGGSATPNITIPSTAYKNMLPGDIVNQSLTITNSGNTPLSMSAILASSDGEWETRLATGQCPATGLVSGAALTTTATGYGRLEAGASSDVCVQVTLPMGAAANAMNTSASYAIEISGVQTTP